MTFLGLFKRWSDENVPDEYDDQPNTQPDDKPCNVSGHNYETKYSPNYFSHSKIAFFSKGKEKFRVKKKTMEKCTKCGGFNRTEETLGYIVVNDDETLSVEQ